MNPGATFITLALFHGARDNQPILRRMAWDDWCTRLFSRGWTVPKLETPAVAGADFNGLRASQNVVSKTAIILDFDNSSKIPDPSGECHSSGRLKLIDEMIENPVRVQDVFQQLKRIGIAACGWTTNSHKGVWPKHRALVPFDEPIDPALFPKAVVWFLRESGLDQFQRGIDMPVVLDLARMNFLPSHPNDVAMIERWRTDGEILHIPIHELDLVNVPEPVRPQWQRTEMANRATSAWWLDYPGVDFKLFDVLSALSNLGCKVGPMLNGKARCQCPWSYEHSHQSNGLDAFVRYNPGFWPDFRCSHSSHSHLGLADLVASTLTKNLLL